MKKYTKPTVLLNEELSEGVYTASGSECYAASAYIHQTPQQGRGDYRIQVNGTHAAADNHHSGAQVLILTFNQPVSYVGSNGSLQGGDGTSSIRIAYNYHNNASESVGLGDVIVTSDPGLAVVSAEIQCNLNCGMH